MRNCISALAFLTSWKRILSARCNAVVNSPLRISKLWFIERVHCTTLAALGRDPQGLARTSEKPPDEAGLGLERVPSELEPVRGDQDHECGHLAGTRSVSKSGIH